MSRAKFSEDGTDIYNHAYILNSIDAMINDDENKGIYFMWILRAGSVYASRRTLSEDKRIPGTDGTSGVLVHAVHGGLGRILHFRTFATDYRNRNCWTGSIGVTMGTIYDITGLLEKAGIKTRP